MPLDSTTETFAALLSALRDERAWNNATFDERALALYSAQRARVPAYDAWCTYELQSRTTGEVAHWQQIPALPIAAYKQLIVAAPDAPIAAAFESSGTTASERSRHLLARVEQYDASLDVGVAAAVVPDVVRGERDPIACVQLQPSREHAPNSSLSHMFDRIRQGPWCRDAGCFVDGDYELDAAGSWGALQELASRGAPVLVLATSFALVQLLERAAAEGWPAIQLPDASRVVDTGGYKGRSRELTRAELLDQVQRQLGVSARWCENEYGMSELSSQAWLGTIAASCGHPLELTALGARWTPPHVRVRVVDPETLEPVADGDTGLLVFHDLANVWSCAAVRTEDLGRRRGDGFELIGRAPGATLKGCSLRVEELAPAR